MIRISRVVNRFSQLLGLCGPQQGGTGLDASAAAPGRVLAGTGSGLALTALEGDATLTVTPGDGTLAISVGTIPTSKVAGLDAALAGKADDAAVVHRSGDEVVDGQKSLTGTYTTFGTVDAGAHLLASGYRNELLLAFPGDHGTYHASEGPISFSPGDRGTGNPSLTLNPDGTASHLSILATGTSRAVSVADRFARELHAKDFGATGDGTTDDTAALQAWLNAAIQAGGKGVLDRPANYYKVTGTLLIEPPGGDAQAHCDLEGIGAYPAAIQWAGANGKPIIRVVGLKLSRIENINLKIPASASGVAAWDLDNTAAAPSLSDLTFSNCRVDLGTGATSCHGWRLGHGTEWVTATDGPIDQNGDISFLSFLGCTVNGAETGGGNAGWRSEHQNVLNNSWYNGCASRVDCGITNIPTAGAAASGGKGGQSIFTHGFGTTHNVVDYEFGTVGSYGIFGGRYELGTTFLKVPSGLGSAGLAVAVSGSELGGYDVAGGHVLDIGSSANVHLDGVTVYPNTTPFGPGMVNLASAAGVPGSLRMTNCLLGGESPLHTIAPGSGPWTVRLDGCQAIDIAGVITGTIDDYATDLAATVKTTGSYADPAWLTSLSGAKVSGDIAGNAAGITGSIATSQVTGLGTAATHADGEYVHSGGDESIAGRKTFVDTYLIIGSTSTGGHLLADGYRNEILLAFPADHATYHVAEGPILFSPGDRGTGNASLTLNTDGSATFAAGVLAAQFGGDGSGLTGVVAANGLPAGGTAGQVLAKVDAADFHSQWADAGGSTAAAVSYDDATSGLGAADVQGAIDSLNAIVAEAVAQGSGLISGGGVAWATGYQYRVSAARYYIAGVAHDSAEQAVTLSPADATYDRFDLIALDATGTAVAITGTASPTPVVPDLDPQTQLQLTLVRVDAATTQPAGGSSDPIFAEGAGGEWAASTNNAGQVNVASTSNPHSGTVDVEGTAVANGTYVQFQAGSPLDVTTRDSLVFSLRSKGGFAKKSIQVSFRNSGAAVGMAVNLADGAFGFNSSNTTSYQQVVIPISQFAIPAGSTADRLRLTVAGGGASLAGFYLDDCSLQAGAAPPGTESGLTTAQADARYAQRAQNLSDLTDAATARTNLGLGTLATQAASSVSITGGTLAGVTLASHGGGYATSNFGAFNLAVSDWHARTLDGTNGTLTPSGELPGQIFTLVLTQDATGSRVVSWWSGITWMTAGGAEPQPATAAGKISTYTFKCLGSGSYLGYAAGSNA